jgi:hypothetical protein
MSFVLVYKGGARDHETKPQVYAKGDDGRPDKRRVLKPAETKFFEIATYNIWGTEFPRGKEIRVSDAKLAAKARALGCFDVREASGDKPRQ